MLIRTRLFSVLILPAALFAQSADKCTGLTALKELPNPSTAITTAALKPPSAETRNPGGRGVTPALPEHCEIRGKMNERTGANGQHYAINFHMRLPTQWNGKFFFEGGGGSNGNMGDALGNLQGQQPGNALVLGYAVVSQDSGHDNATNNDPKLNGSQTFGWDEQARLDFGYNSYDQVTQAAKAVIQAYYGKPPERSYYVGCSEGGREGMMMSQRFPDYFDGILACSPGFKLPKAAIAEAWDTQALADVAKGSPAGPVGVPLINKTFSDADVVIIASAIENACDGLDGVVDTIVSNFAACNPALVHPRLVAATCKAEKTNDCLTAAQVAAFEKLMNGAKNSKGETLYSDWPWDVGIAYPGWRIWKLGPYAANANTSINTLLGSQALAAIFTTPPTALPSSGTQPVSYLLNFSFDKDAPKIFAEDSTFAKSSWDFMMASSTDLDGFQKRGGRLLIVQGVSDPVFSINDTISWLGDVEKKYKGKASDFVRLFGVPGMNHCAGGPATDRFDAFGALVAWVEKKTPPNRIIATAGQESPWPNRTRPLCSYPAHAHYDGKGPLEEATSFVCTQAQPRR
jgi:pimeloyl-ACP methyl ester carboxylesterase